MKITTKGRYGLRAMVALAENFGKGPLPMSYMANRQGQSRKYLHNLLTLLRTSGLVATVKGKQGGYVLTKSPKKINLKDMIYSLEGPIGDIECFNDIKKVKNPKKCKVRQMWIKITTHIETLLKSITLDDMAEGDCQFVGGKIKINSKKK